VSPVLINKFNSKLGWKNFSKLAAQCSTKVFALGGMNFLDLEIARKHGAHGIAGISMFT
jgi:thiamine-phosphate pyrophosphorylase